MKWRSYVRSLHVSDVHRLGWIPDNASITLWADSLVTYHPETMQCLLDEAADDNNTIVETVVQYLNQCLAVSSFNGAHIVGKQIEHPQMKAKLNYLTDKQALLLHNTPNIVLKGGTEEYKDAKGIIRKRTKRDKNTNPFNIWVASPHRRLFTGVMFDPRGTTPPTVLN